MDRRADLVTARALQLGLRSDQPHRVAVDELCLLAQNDPAVLRQALKRIDAGLEGGHAPIRASVFLREALAQTKTAQNGGAPPCTT